jgi:hypothetical protein
MQFRDGSRSVLYRYSTRDWPEISRVESSPIQMYYLPNQVSSPQIASSDLMFKVQTDPDTGICNGISHFRHVYIEIRVVLGDKRCYIQGN